MNLSTRFLTESAILCLKESRENLLKSRKIAGVATTLYIAKKELSNKNFGDIHSVALALIKRATICKFKRDFVECLEDAIAILENVIEEITEAARVEAARIEAEKEAAAEAAAAEVIEIIENGTFDEIDILESIGDNLSDCLFHVEHAIDYKHLTAERMNLVKLLSPENRARLSNAPFMEDEEDLVSQMIDELREEEDEQEEDGDRPLTNQEREQLADRKARDRDHALISDKKTPDGLLVGNYPTITQEQREAIERNNSAPLGSSIDQSNEEDRVYDGKGRGGLFNCCI